MRTLNCEEFLPNHPSVEPLETFSQLLGKLNEIELEKDVKNVAFKVLHKPGVPVGPIRPRFWLTIIYPFAFGTILGFGVILITGNHRLDVQEPGRGSGSHWPDLPWNHSGFTGLKVLLIDGDLRKPVLHTFFFQTNKLGLTDYVLGEPLERVMLPTGQPNLWLLPTGPLPPNPSDFLGSTAMEKRFEELTERFDMVLFDAPVIGMVCNFVKFYGPTDYKYGYKKYHS